jgi:hypothetical protein
MKYVYAIIMGPQDESCLVWVCDMDLVGGDMGAETIYLYDLDRINLEDGTKMHSFGKSATVNYDGGQKICVTNDRKHLFESSSKDSTMAKYTLRDNVAVGKFSGIGQSIRSICN